MSESTTPEKKVELTPEQGRAQLVKMFQMMHTNMGAISRLIMANPTPEGYLIPTEQAGQAVTMLTRSRGLIERILTGSGSQVPQKPDASPDQSFKPGETKDGVLVAAFAPAPAVNLSQSGVDIANSALNQLQTMSVAAVESSTQRINDLIGKHQHGREAL